MRDDLMMTAAFEIAKSGTCSRRKCGAVITDVEGITIAYGNNCAVHGLPQCEPHSDYKACEVSEHAERNAIYDAAKFGMALKGGSMYCTDAPCHGCARAIIQVGIERVTYSRTYSREGGLQLLGRAGIQVFKWGTHE